MISPTIRIFGGDEGACGESEEVEGAVGVASANEDQLSTLNHPPLRLLVRPAILPFA